MMRTRIDPQVTLRSLPRVRGRAGERVFPQWGNPEEEKSLTRASGATCPARGRGEHLHRLFLIGTFMSSIFSSRTGSSTAQATFGSTLTLK